MATSPTYPIRGIPTTPGPESQVPLRREIDEWWFSRDLNDLNQQTLFILALRKLMEVKPDPWNPQSLSYFSIAGIHGQPLLPWDSETKKNSFYCAHGKVTFPTWHRPYLSLYEQRLYETMLELIPIAFGAELQAEMFEAAKTWRLPYWDWAMRKPDWISANAEDDKDESGVGPNVPYVLTQKDVEVRTTTGITRVENPLWRYVLPKGAKYDTFGPYGISDRTGKDEETGKLYQKYFSLSKATCRYPTIIDKNDPKFESVWAEGNENNWDRIRGALRGPKAVLGNTLPEAVYRLFSQLPTYPQFANEGWDVEAPPEQYASLEDVHGNVHDLIGGDGQMGMVPVAAFDPIFWLHHCNVDRIFAMWQDLYDEKYAAWLKGSPQAKDKLAPFHKDKTGSFYDSFDCSYQQKDLGYTYPELQKWLPEYKTNGVFDPVKYKKSIRTAVEEKYSTTGKMLLILKKNQAIAKAHMSHMARHGQENLNTEYLPAPLVKLAESPAPDAEANSPPAEQWVENDYIINVVYDRFALNGDPYHVRFFLGDVPQANLLNNFEATPTQIGQVYNFSGGVNDRGASSGGCENCKEQQDAGKLFAGQLVLTDYLVEAIYKKTEMRDATLETLQEQEVVEFLRKNLHWRITDRYNRVILKEDMPALKISVAKGKATHYLEISRFSQYGDYKVLWEVTRDRLAGAVPDGLGPNIV